MLKETGWVQRFEFTPPLEENSEIFCTDCSEWSSWEKWREGEVGCEDCGSHNALICPLCDRHFDSVRCEPFKTRSV